MKDMPFIHVELVEGRSTEQLTAMMKDITDAVHKNTGAPKEHIHVIINEMKKGTYAVNGEFK
ncbi:4-oxalocrotonate tautomerase [Enterococcus dispar]|nr:4-oxalocrotonate tautomerase [Enterococcus dispar]